jgi:hypothetical protein
MSRITELAAARLPDSGGDLLILLMEQDDRATVLIHWPSKQPTSIDPARFGDLASTVVKLFGEAHVTLARVRRHRS